MGKTLKAVGLSIGAMFMLVTGIFAVLYFNNRKLLDVADK